MSNVGLPRAVLNLVHAADENAERRPNFSGVWVVPGRGAWASDGHVLLQVHYRTLGEGLNAPVFLPRDSVLTVLKAVKARGAWAEVATLAPQGDGRWCLAADSVQVPFSSGNVQPPDLASAFVSIRNEETQYRFSVAAETLEKLLTALKKMYGSLSYVHLHFTVFGPSPTRKPIYFKVDDGDWRLPVDGLLSALRVPPENSELYGKPVPLTEEEADGGDRPS
ncbi:MAG: hypothetical protein QXX12_01005 [Nanopusillaceae archaeon]